MTSRQNLRDVIYEWPIICCWFLSSAKKIQIVQHISSVIFKDFMYISSFTVLYVEIYSRRETWLKSLRIFLNWWDLNNGHVRCLGMLKAPSLKSSGLHSWVFQDRHDRGKKGSKICLQKSYKIRKKIENDICPINITQPH